VDDHPVVRAGLRAYLERHADLTVAGEAASLADARAWLSREAPPALVILDLKLPDGRGTDLIADVRAAAPAARILVLSSFPEEEAVRAAMAAGAHGWLDKQQDPAALADGVRAALRGELPLAREAVRALATPPREDPFAELTPREREVLRAIARGLSNREIARRLGVREKTVKTHAGHVYAKLGVTRRTQAALLARERWGDGADGLEDERS
jgi:DNA-binding NarL/FixJ family response regulator